jgi:hypothetical protein
MRNNFQEISSLEDSDVDVFTHRRSKSSHTNINNTPPREKRFLLKPPIQTSFEQNENEYEFQQEIREIETEGKGKHINRQEIQEIDLTEYNQNTQNTKSSKNTKTYIDQMNKDKFLNMLNIQTFSTLKDNNKLTANDNSQAVQTELSNSMEFSLNSVRVGNKNETWTKSDAQKFYKLKEKYKVMKAKLEVTQNAEKNWRRSYFNLLKDSLTWEETIKNLMEENRIHQEYIISIENKLNKLLVSCNNITNSFHKSLNIANLYASNQGINLNYNYNTNTNNSQAFNQFQSFRSGNNENISPNENLNFEQILNDYKKQLEILSDEKENLYTNLSISRHQQLQSSLKLENLQTRLFNIEQARLEDLKFFEKIKN